MILAHNAKISVFCKEDENEAQILERFLALFPFSLGEEKLTIHRQKAVSFNERMIIILELTLEKERHVKAFLRHLHDILPERSRQIIISQRESRLDENLHFYIRLDKEKWLKNEAWVTDDGNCYHINIGIAAFPAKREKALQAVEQIFG